MSEHVNPYTVGEKALAAQSFDKKPIASSVYGSARDTSSIAKLSIAGLVAQSLVAMTSIGFCIKAWMADSNGTSDDLFYNHEGEFSVFSQLWDQISNLSSVCYIFTVIVFLIWTNHSMKNAWAMHGSMTTPETTPGWAAGFYFIPLVMLWKPVQAISQIWVRADKDNQKSPIISAWWTFWIFSMITTKVVSRQAEDEFTEISTHMAWAIGDSIVSIISASCLVYVIHTITTRHLRQLEESPVSILDS